MSKKFIIGIDLGGTNLKIGLLDLRYNLKDKMLLGTQRFETKESLIQQIINSINNILIYNKLNKTHILGIGLGVPGPVNPREGIVHYLPNIPGWKEVRLKDILETRLRLPVFLDNDANLMCLAEYKLGAARRLKNVVCLTLGTGVGGGIIVEGKLYRGSSFGAGEIGHIPINEKGPGCNCGGIACLETYIGNNSIIKKAKRLFKQSLSLEELSRMARKNNRMALRLWSEVGTYLGIALTGVVNLLNPDAIVIGGGVANAGKVLFAQVKEIIAKRAMSVGSRRVKIFKAKLENDAGLIGAAILVKNNLK